MTPDFDCSNISLRIKTHHAAYTICVMCVIPLKTLIHIHFTKYNSKCLCVSPPPTIHLVSLSGLSTIYTTMYAQLWAGSWSCSLSHAHIRPAEYIYIYIYCTNSIHFHLFPSFSSNRRADPLHCCPTKLSFPTSHVVESNFPKIDACARFANIIKQSQTYYVFSSSNPHQTHSAATQQPSEREKDTLSSYVANRCQTAHI